MKLENLPKVKSKSAKRIGRGQGSGKGKTSKRGTKGQKARSKVSIFHPHYEGGQRPLFKRLPYRRGKGNAKISTKPLIIKLSAINLIPKGETVNLNSLIKYKIVNEDDAEKYGVKILGDGNLTTSYNFEVMTSKRVAAAIEKVGGKIINSKQTRNTESDAGGTYSNPKSKGSAASSSKSKIYSSRIPKTSKRYKL